MDEDHMRGVKEMSMTETRMGIIAGIALTIMGAMDFLRHRSGRTVATALLVIEVAAIIVG
jgi:uncharacterized membrane protein